MVAKICGNNQYCKSNLIQLTIGRIISDQFTELTTLRTSDISEKFEGIQKQVPVINKDWINKLEEEAVTNATAQIDRARSHIIYPVDSTPNIGICLPNEYKSK